MGVIAGGALRVLLRCRKDAFTIPLMALATYYVGRLTIIGLMGLPSALAVVLFVFGLIQGVYALSERWSDPRVGQLATRGGA